MKKQNATLVFRLDCENTRIPLFVGRGKLSSLPKEGDILVLNAKLEKPIFLKTLEIDVCEDSSIHIEVQYFGGKDVLSRASEDNSSIVPMGEIKPCLDSLAICMLYAE